jgi:hypothetical protein
MKRALVATLLVVASSLCPLNADAQTQPSTGEVSESPPPSPAAPQEAPKPKEEAPRHVSTGWGALVKDSLGDFKAFPLRPSTWVILGIGGAGALATHPFDNKVQQQIVGNETADTFFSLGQWVGNTYVMVGSSVGVWAVGRYIIGPSENEPKTNKYSELGFDMMRGQILAQAIVQGTKQAVRRDRPTGECCSFPSGHAASAFAMASVLERHMGYRASWPFIAGAFYVATSRLVDNQHFLSDVMFGAAVGTAAGWTVVGRRHGNNEYTMQPVPVDHGMMILVTKVPPHLASEHGHN